MDIIKIVVQDNNLFGFIYPEIPNNFCILSALHTKGAYNSAGTSVLVNDTCRPAEETDFDLFRVERTQFDTEGKKYNYGVSYEFNRGIIL